LVTSGKRAIVTAKLQYHHPCTYGDPRRRTL
jgi:hypothetical protein